MTRVLLTLLIGLVVSLWHPKSSLAQYSTDYWEKYSDDVVCSASVRFSKKLNKKVWGDHSGNNQNASRLEAWRRSLSCGVSEPDYQLINKELNTYALERSDYGICFLATKDGGWEVREDWVKYVETAKSRGLSCGVSEEAQTVTASNDLESKSDKWICDIATTEFSKLLYHSSRPAGRTTSLKYSATSWNYAPWAKLALSEAKRRGLNCGVGETTQTASASSANAAPKVKPKATSAALTAAEKEAERLRQELAALRAEKAAQKQTISNDTNLPTITIASANTKGKQGIIRGRVNDNTGIAEVTVDGTVVPLTSNGNFEYSTFVPSGGLSLKVQATDLAGLTSMMSVTLERNAGTATAAINFDRLNPMGKRVKINKDALALIIGVADYENTPAKAIFADSDAMMFRDYASEKLGIPESRIKTLVNDGADERELLLSVKSWLARASNQGKSDVYVFFAGHGLASDNGEKMYLLPYDGSPELLDDTAILRDRLFSDIASANPRSVTVFLDTCYSGTTRGTDMLIASRPIAIKALKQSIPDNFTVMTAAAGDQTAKPLEEAKHGMFSYFLMKGMEGEADANNDNKITAGELHKYVQQNVIQQSSGSQTPELQGDAERVLVRFQ
ncbi:caspase family protein [Candidatus Puniceispirillum sp.]|nr:caspase family protein [Candidatus Puniceispirillum sp.]